jgi:hypothetical protein
MFPEVRKLNFDKINFPSAGITGADPTEHIRRAPTIWSTGFTFVQIRAFMKHVSSGCATVTLTQSRGEAETQREKGLEADYAGFDATLTECDGVI